MPLAGNPCQAKKFGVLRSHTGRSRRHGKRGASASDDISCLTSDAVISFTASGRRAFGFERKEMLVRRTVTGMMPPALFFSLLMWMVLPAAAEPFLDLYTGKSFTQSSDITVKQPTLRNDYTFKDVSFDDKSFETPPWYGLRVGYYFEKYPWLGAAIEFFHFKMIADTAESKRVTGTRSGAGVDTTTRVDSIIQQFQVTHGVNYLTLDALIRYPLLEEEERFRHGRAQLYAGLGVGPVIAHAENVVDNVRNDEGYEVGGVGIQVFVGARALLFKYLGLFAEYKFTHSGLEIGVAAGVGRVEENTHHLVGGVTIPLPFF